MLVGLPVAQLLEERALVALQEVARYGVEPLREAASQRKYPSRLGQAVMWCRRRLSVIVQTTKQMEEGDREEVRDSVKQRTKGVLGGDLELCPYPISVLLGGANSRVHELRHPQRVEWMPTRTPFLRLGKNQISLIRRQPTV